METIAYDGKNAKIRGFHTVWCLVRLGTPLALRTVGSLSGPLPYPGALLLEGLIRQDEERWGNGIPSACAVLRLRTSSNWWAVPRASPPAWRP
jgi:hypothetical protein